MQIRVGFELIYRVPQPTPMIMTVDLHYSRASDVLSNDVSPPIYRYRSQATRDGFGTGVVGYWRPLDRYELRTARS